MCRGARSEWPGTEPWACPVLATHPFPEPGFLWPRPPVSSFEAQPRGKDRRRDLSAGAGLGAKPLGVPLRRLVDRASPTRTGQLRVGKPRVSLLLAAAPLMPQDASVISGRKSVDAAFAFEGEACNFCIDAVRSVKGLSWTRNSREKNGNVGWVGASRASPTLPALGYGLPRLLAARYEGCGLSPQEEDGQRGQPHLRPSSPLSDKWAPQWRPKGLGSVL